MSADAVSSALVTLGAVFLASLVVDVVGRRTRLPRVTLLLLLGVSVGPVGLDIMPAWGESAFPLISNLALVMVAFLLGGELRGSFFRDHGRAVLVLSFVVVLTTLIIVSLGLRAMGWPLEVALLLGAVATSTDPIAVRDVVREGQARGPITRRVLGIVAVDDAWGIISMSLMLAVVVGLQDPALAGPTFVDGLRDLTVATLLGCAIGVPVALLSGRVRAGEPTLAEALGAVLLCGGLAIHLDVSFLLSAITMGLVVANLARHHRRTFRAIEGIEWPFMILFFVLSGATLRTTALESSVVVAFAYVLFRAIGRWLGGWLGARFTSRSETESEIGVALLPQAGIAIGMALVVSQRSAEHGSEILAATVSGVICFEILGPLLTRAVLRRAGEIAES